MCSRCQSCLPFCSSQVCVNWLCIPSRLPGHRARRQGHPKTLLEDVFPTVYSVLYCEDCFLDYTTGVVGHQPPRAVVHNSKDLKPVEGMCKDLSAQLPAHILACKGCHVWLEALGRRRHRNRLRSEYASATCVKRARSTPTCKLFTHDVDERAQMATNVGMKPGHEQTLSMHLDGRLPSIACPDHATLRGRHVSACSGGHDGRTVNRLRNGACGVWLGALQRALGHFRRIDHRAKDRPLSAPQGCPAAHLRRRLHLTVLRPCVDSVEEQAKAKAISLAADMYPRASNRVLG